MRDYWSYLQNAPVEPVQTSRIIVPLAILSAIGGLGVMALWIASFLP